MTTLTIHAPWAWAIVAGFKPVENRQWATHYRGPLCIHAGTSGASDAAAAELFGRLGIEAPADWDSLRGRVLGGAVVVGCDAAEPGGPCPWTVGPYAWRLGRVAMLAEPPPAKGKLSLWNFDGPEAAELERLLAPRSLF